jgi:hypothetical protein
MRTVQSGKGETMPKKSKDGKANKGSSSSWGHVQKSGHEKGHGNAGGSWENKQGKSMDKVGKSKDGCLPKLFMLVLPFIAFGAYVFLRS